MNEKNERLKHYLTSDIYEAAFFVCKSEGECRPTILTDHGKKEAIFSFRDVPRNLPIDYRKSDLYLTKATLIEIKREMFRILDRENGKGKE